MKNTSKFLLSILLGLSTNNLLSVYIKLPEGGGVNFHTSKSTTNKDVYDFVQTVDSDTPRDAIKIIIRGDLLPDNDEPIDFDSIGSLHYTRRPARRVIAAASTEVVMPAEEMTYLSPVEQFIKEIEKESDIYIREMELKKKLREVWR